MKKILVICGATATGKTKLAVDCALKLGSEVISADSQLVYRGLDIGTAKPSLEEMRGVKHHLIDVADACEPFSVGEYRELAEPVLQRLLNEEKTPVICGGTGFYIKSLLFEFGYGKTVGNSEIRERYGKFAKRYGNKALHEKLKAVDSQAALKLHPNDVKRVIRALEIFDLSGQKKSEQSDELKPKRDYVAVAINWPREELYSRIDQRVDEMFEQGLLGEVENLLAQGVDETCQSMQAIGYKEVLYGIINGDLSCTMRDVIKRNTRRYAKRQITFFKKMPNLVWLAPEDATSDKVLEILNEDNRRV